MIAYLYKLYSDIDEGEISVEVSGNKMYCVDDKIVNSIFYNFDDDTLSIRINGNVHNTDDVKEYVDTYVSNICYNLSTGIYSFKKIVLFKFLRLEKIYGEGDDGKNEFILEDNISVCENVKRISRCTSEEFYETITKEQGELKKLYKLFDLKNYCASQFVALYELIKSKLRKSKPKCKKEEISSNEITQFYINNYKYEDLTDYNDNGCKIDKFTAKRNGISHFNSNSIDDYILINDSVKTFDLFDLLDFAKAVFGNLNSKGKR